ncbi:hypothetical protein OX283_012310 [Flavobacterium sp. SUN052]|uniref:hypothetical protein n=1 Tax=Flavobacterium sp. SUN052 TaxID=3002441 RepID=UPI00237D5D05|nr:hypothetical protein [Flavobacterium sp. SUN052]MEC4005444.1 hypothetical protein [Flavobacterium sp. SUN052]
MSTIEIKNELHQIIDNSNPTIVQNFYDMIKGFLKNSEESTMILESEDDINSSKIHSQDDVVKIIKSWKE